jgi:DNA-binding winged helix-turn-helix (wHTH) protein
VPSFPPFRLDLEVEQLWRGEKRVAVRRKPMAILRYLIAHPRRLVTHDELLREVWGGAAVSESAVRSHLHDLRSILGEGVIETVIGRGYRFTAELGDDDAAAAAPRDPGPGRIVVGREAELALLRAALDRARTGHRQLCFVTGEPGIGKTTLVDAFLDELDDRGEVLAARGACVEQRGTPEPYSPVIELVGQLRRSAHGDEVLAALVRFAPTFLAMVPHLVPDAQLDEIDRRARGGSEARMVRELIEALETFASQRALVVVLEDLQWSDVATLDLLAVLGQRRERARLMVIATSRRAEAQTVAHPLNNVMRSLVARAGAVAVPLDRIEPADVARLVDRRCPDHAFPPGFAGAIDRVTGGTPLFVVTVLDDLVQRGMLEERAGRWHLAASLDDIAAHRPDSLKQLIDIQLDRLAAPEQRVLEAAALIGVELSTDLVAAALEQPVEAIDELCDGLVRRALFLRREASEEWPDGTLQTRYAVAHSLVREVCLDRSSPSRRQRWHRAIAERLEVAYGARTPEIAHVLAAHHDQGQSTARAIHHYELAGAQAAQRFAAHDGIRFYRRARELLGKLPASLERDRQELQILGVISSLCLGISEGLTSEPLVLFEQTVALARRLDDAPRLYKGIANLALRHSTLAEHVRAREIGAELVELARRHAIAPALLEFGDMVRAFDAMHHDDLATAQELFERLATSTDASPKPVLRTAGVTAQLAVVLALRGDRDRALLEARRAVALARGIGEPFAIGLTLVALARVQLARRDPIDELRETVDAIRNVPPGISSWARHDAHLFEALCRAHTAPLDEPAVRALVATFRDRVAAYPMGATAIAIPVALALQRSGRIAEARAIVDEMLAFAHDRRELAHVPDLSRLRDELA